MAGRGRSTSGACSSARLCAPAQYPSRRAARPARPAPAPLVRRLLQLTATRLKPQFGTSCRFTEYEIVFFTQKQKYYLFTLNSNYANECNPLSYSYIWFVQAPYFMINFLYVAYSIKIDIKKTLFLVFGM